MEDETSAALYERINREQLELGAELEKLVVHTETETIVDVGCGTGELSYDLARRAQQYRGKVVALDPDEGRLNIAVANKPEDVHNLKFVRAGGEDLGFLRDESVSTIFSSYAIQWIEDKHRAFGEFHRCLQSRGSVVFEAPDGPPPLCAEVSTMLGVMDRFREHVFFISEAEWREIFETTRFRVERFEHSPTDLVFPSLQACLEWWKGTTVGIADYTQLSDQDLQQLRARYPQEVHVLNSGTRVVLRKIE